MPKQELPEDYNRPVDSSLNSSLSSNSSGVIMINARYVRSTVSSSESSGTVNDEFETSILNEQFTIHNENLEEKTTYQPIKLPKEPTLEELLVRKLAFISSDDC